MSEINLNVNWLYSIFDTVKKTFDPPFCAVNDESAFRGMETMFARSPELRATRNDFKLFKVGCFNFIDGSIDFIEPVEINVNGEDV